jgi:preprotein translocase subunit SecF
LFEIVKPGTKIDFLGKWKIAAVCSLVLIGIGLAGIPLRGFRMGVDFAGGTEMQVRFTGEGAVSEAPIRKVLGDLGIANASVVRVGESSEFLLKFQGERRIEGEGTAQPAPGPEAPAPAAEAEAPAPEAPAAGGEITSRTDRIIQLESALAERVGPLEVTRVEFVGPKVGAELRNDGLAALGIACLLILAYIAFRFTPRYAPGAVVALVHDLAVTSAVWIVFGLEFDLRVLAALLAVLGYSLNDTIIVYDRIRENLALHTKSDLAEVLNRSVNETLSRTLLTSGTTLITVLALLFLGGEVVRPFALAMAIGIFVGTYSSIYVAAPILLWFERWRGGANGAKAAPKTRAAAKA